MSPITSFGAARVDIAMSAASASRLDLVALNPQPLPPAEIGSGVLQHIDDFCGTVPKRVPPPLPGPFDGGALRLHALFERF